MEQNTTAIAKKLWKIVKVLYFMLRKGISKGKLLADLNMMMKRGKIASKAAIHNIMFHHHHHHGGAAANVSFPDSLNEYEFSCSNSPTNFRLPFHLNKSKSSSHALPFDSEAMAAALEMMSSSAAASPMLPGFGPSPMVRQLRITDSPFPLRDVDGEENNDHHVDEAAEEFINRFYKDLKRQNSKALLNYY